MCEAKVFLDKDGELEEYMDNVVIIRPEGEKLLLIDLFGEQKFLKADIKELKLLDHKVILSQV
ncbi:MAG: CooT family nickel-binding protein [Actinomycetota bacterium]|nr:CooT family nickel-binding protein [Actinomycetota bacterium]